MANQVEVLARSRNSKSYLWSFFVGCVLTLLHCTLVFSQSVTPPAPMPEWQTATGGHMEFEVASVKQNKSGTENLGGAQWSSNVPLGFMDAFSPTGGLLSARNYPLLQYMIFAYKLTPELSSAIAAKLPKWAITNRYDIEARAAGNPTKNQYRIMMQALLADRFKLTMHYETHDQPVLAMVLNKPGKPGPQLQLHPAGVPCPTTNPSGPGPYPTVAGGFPEACGALTPVAPSVPGHYRTGARDVPMSMLATAFSSNALGRPLIDKTGIAGNVDFAIEIGPGPQPGQPDSDATGPTILQAFKEQLGIKLEPQTAPIQTIVLDHVEELTEN